jgi:hypothetical protein
MMQSMTAALHGDTFWFTPNASAAGLLIHMLTGAMYGIGLALLARRLRTTSLLVAAGMAYGLLALVFSGFVGLPAAASIAGAGKTISDMAHMVGWGTFTVEHLIFGMTLGLGAAALPLLTGPTSPPRRRSVVAA